MRLNYSFAGNAKRLSEERRSVTFNGDPARDFWRQMHELGFDFYAGVPDSTFGPASYEVLLERPDVTYLPAPREDIALGIVSAAYFRNRRAAVIMQNSGIGNTFNALTSFNLVYKIPAFLIVGWRGYGTADQDAPEHSVMGQVTDAAFEMLGIPHSTLDPSDWRTTLTSLIAEMDRKSIPTALLVPARTLS